MDPGAAGHEWGTLPTSGHPREQWALSKTRLGLGCKKGLIEASSQQGVKRAPNSPGTGVGLSPVAPQHGGAALWGEHQRAGRAP